MVAAGAPDATDSSFGYTMNRQGMAVGLDARGQALVDAAYIVLGAGGLERGGSWYG